ncbi:MAG: putative lipid II flippase FtsW [Lachnospiraceae bacterium]|nr:putative lipid II flippase FtsW [Lachnospiraceae bacterium]
MSKKGYIKRKWDMSLLVTVIFLVCFGLVMVYSTSSYEAAMKFNDSAFYLKKQLIATALGVLVMFFTATIDYHVWKRFAIIGYLLTIVCILLVMTPLGIEANGARRWIGVKSFSFQPAELAKLAIIIFFAAFLSKKPNLVNKLGTSITMLFYAGLIALMILVITKNLSSAIIIAGIAYIMMIVASKKSKWYIVVAVALCAIAVGGLLLAGGYRLKRIRVWLEPEAYAQEGGFQTLQALYALGSGGLFGKGLGQSVQKLGFVPEAQNDMVFSIICEELGIFGGIAIIILFAFMIWRFMAIANNAEDLFGTLIVIGIMAHIALQVILNIAVVTNTIPNTGITLPFISYGGTSTVFIMAEMGLALSVSKGKKIRRQVITDEEA